MRATYLLVLLLACSSKDTSTCPSAAELARGSASAITQQEVEIAVAQCRSEKWSSEVTTCLRAAKDDDALEGCLDKLSPEQKKALKVAFGPIKEANRKTYADEQRSKARWLHDNFVRTLGDEGREQLFRSSAECAAFRAAIVDASTAVIACPKAESLALQTFGLHQQALGDIKKALALPAAEQAAACKKASDELRGSRTCGE